MAAVSAISPCTDTSSARPVSLIRESLPFFSRRPSKPGKSDPSMPSSEADTFPRAPSRLISRVSTVMVFPAINPGTPRDGKRALPLNPTVKSRCIRIVESVNSRPP